MIYKINNKPYVKAENYYAELEATQNGLVPKKPLQKIYEEDIKETNLETFTNSEEYMKKKSIFEKTEIKRKDKIL